MRPRRSVNDRHKWSRFGSPFPFRANNKGGKNRKIGEIVRRLPAVSAPRIAPDPSTWILDDVVKPENRIVFASAGRRERGAGRFALLFSRLPIPARMDRSVNVSLSYNLQSSKLELSLLTIPYLLFQLEFNCDTLKGGPSKLHRFEAPRCTCICNDGARRTARKWKCRGGRKEVLIEEYGRWGKREVSSGSGDPWKK